MKGNRLKANRKKRNILNGMIFIQAGFNNTIITVTDMSGNAIAWSSNGKMGFKGSKKSTPYAAQVATLSALEKAKEFGLQTAQIKVVGAGVGRESALRAMIGSGIIITSIEDRTYLPHNGCRPPKRRRQ